MSQINWGQEASVMKVNFFERLTRLLLFSSIINSRYVYRKCRYWYIKISFLVAKFFDPGIEKYRCWYRKYRYWYRKVSKLVSKRIDISIENIEAGIEKYRYWYRKILILVSRKFDTGIENIDIGIEKYRTWYRKNRYRYRKKSLLVSKIFDTSIEKNRYWLGKYRKYCYWYRKVSFLIYYINNSEIPRELSRESFISAHVKIKCYLHTWRGHRRYGYIINRAFESKLIWFFTGVYIINRILHTRL